MMKMKASTRPERRGRNRPVAGDWKACPGCAAGMLVFTDDYSGSSAPATSNGTIPAWVCDKCPNVMFVRAEHQPSAVRQSARNVRATANRTLMKARFVRSRADRALRKSLSRKPPRS